MASFEPSKVKYVFVGVNDNGILDTLRAWDREVTNIQEIKDVVKAEPDYKQYILAQVVNFFDKDNLK